MTIADLLRLLAVPAFAWAAWRDHRTRRVPGRLWSPLAAVGLLALALDWLAAGSVRLLAVRVLLSVGFLAVLGYGFWWFGLFGAADRKAFLVLGVLFPTYPSYIVAGVRFPLVETAPGVLSLSAVTNAAVLGLLAPIGLALWNAANGDLSRVMFLGRPIQWTEVPEANGKLMESPDGTDLDGLDLDALRMYLRWRGITLADVREDADELRDPATLPEEPNPPTGGAVGEDDLAGVRTDGGRDEWGAAAFLDSIEGSAYGTTPRKLRDGLDVLATEETVWVMTGIPFIVPLFGGLVAALVVGDVLFIVLRTFGVVP